MAMNSRPCADKTKPSRLWFAWLGLIVWLVATASISAPVVRTNADVDPVQNLGGPIVPLLSAERKVYRDGTLMDRAFVALPDRLDRQWSQEGTLIVYELPLLPARDDAPRALWLLRVGAPYHLEVGQENLSQRLPPSLPLQDDTAATHSGKDDAADTYLNGRSPALFRLPPQAETARITLTAPAFMPFGLIEALQGPAQPLIRHHLVRYETLSRPVNFSQVMGLSIGLMTLLLWTLRRHQRALLYFGLMALSLGVRETLYSTSVLPLPPVIFELSNPWLIVHFVTAATALTLTLLGSATPARMRHLLFAWSLIQALFAVVAGLHTGAQWIRMFVVLLGNGALVGIVWMLMHKRQALPGWRSWTLLVGYLLLIAGSLHDLGMAVGWTPPTGGTYIAWGFGALVLAYGVVTADYVLRELAQAQRVRAELAERLENFSTALSASLDAVAQSTREQARQEERQQVMRDLHDTLGARLITALRGVERQALDRPALVQLLRATVTDLSHLRAPTSRSERSIGHMLRQWQAEWAPHLERAGMRLSWQPSTEMDLLQASSAVLSVLRAILQEGAANALKHAQATQLTLKCRLDADALIVTLEDDGIGLGCASDSSALRSQAGHGIGLNSLRARARSLGEGVHLDVTDAPTLSGAVLRLSLPLERLRTPQSGDSAGQAQA
jgi:signal transduction histidine kinase